MVLRTVPHAEDAGGVTGGDTDELMRPMAKALPGTAGSFDRPGFPPPGENRDATTTAEMPPGPTDAEMFGRAEVAGTPAELPRKPAFNFLHYVSVAEKQAMKYMQQVNRRAWTISYRAFHNEHFPGSKYASPEWRTRSHFFRPKTRSAVRKDMAAVAASMFGTRDAINTAPGNEGDDRQRAAAAVMKHLVNYRTSRTSGKASIPWFQTVMGCRQDSLLTGICLTKQSWLLELHKEGVVTEPDEKTGVPTERTVWAVRTNRPDCRLIPPENYLIDPAADWTDPAQKSQYLIIKWPMSIEELHGKMENPINPWHHLDDQVLKTAVDSGKMNTSAVRRSREQGLDRIDETQTGTDFQIVWVYETYLRHGGEDWTFYSLSDQYLLTDPKPVREVYPEQGGDRPLTLGYGALEAHRIFPMSNVESWQPHQHELNDLVNLALDAIKQNVMPVTKVVKGRQVDLDQVKRRSSGSSIIVTKPDDVTFDRPPDIPQSVPVMTRSLELEFDDLAGQFNGQTTQDNNALSRTLGGLKLVAGSANAVQEFDIRIWLVTWCEPALAQIVKLEQYYEDDDVILGIAGNKAKLVQKFGISEIDDKLLEEQVTISVSAGLGVGDPQQRLAKFQAAMQIAEPILTQSPDFAQGKIKINAVEIINEIFGAAGYDDGGMRFFEEGDPQQGQNPAQALQQELIQSQIEKNKSQGRSSLMMGLAAVKKVALGDAQLEADKTNQLTDLILRAHDMGQRHAADKHTRFLSERDHGHRHGLELLDHHLDRQRHAHERNVDMASLAQDGQQPDGANGADTGNGAQAPQPQDAQQVVAALQARRPVRYDVRRDHSGKVISMIPVYADSGQMPAAGGAQPPPPGPPGSPGVEVPLPPAAA